MTTKHFLCAALLGSMMLLPTCSPEKRSEEATSENVTEPMNESAMAQEASDGDVPAWLTSKAGPSRGCPLTEAEGTPDNPFFAFSGTTDAPDFNCRQTGPFEWGGKTWFVQRIHSLTTRASNTRCADAGFTAPCLFDGTRACSKQAALNDPTPAGAPAGGAGCGTVEPTKFRKKP